MLILANYFIDHFNKVYNRNIKGLTQAARELMLAYPWPGNVRQLKNTIERAVLIESDEWIEPEDLAIHSERDRVSVAAKDNRKAIPLVNGFTRFEIPAEGISLEKIERDLILSAIEKARGNLSGAARLLNIQRGKLRYRLKKLGIKSGDLYELRSKMVSDT